MKKSLLLGVTIILIISTYLIISRIALPRININDIGSVTISKGLVPIKHLNVDSNKVEIENIISVYNKAKRSYKRGDTTTEITIVFQFKNGKEVSIQGNTQSYQYVSINDKYYKITGEELTAYFRSLYKNSIN